MDYGGTYVVGAILFALMGGFWSGAALHEWTTLRRITNRTSFRSMTLTLAIVCAAISAMCWWHS